jgi:hypothetical protein
MTSPAGDSKMFSKTEIALSAAIVLSTALTASGATKHHDVTHVHHRVLYNIVPDYNPQTHLNSDDPALTGGGSLGYNQNIYNW